MATKNQVCESLFVMAGVALTVCKEETWGIMETKKTIIHSPECGN